MKYVTTRLWSILVYIQRHYSFLCKSLYRSTACLCNESMLLKESLALWYKTGGPERSMNILFVVCFFYDCEALCGLKEKVL